MRDYFAAAALPAVVALITTGTTTGSLTLANKPIVNIGEKEMAEVAYAMADALLKARGGPLRCHGR